MSGHALARFTIQTFPAESLDERVEGLLEILFPTALSATYEPLLLGGLEVVLLLLKVLIDSSLCVIFRRNRCVGLLYGV